jgi:hypothetical protein
MSCDRRAWFPSFPGIEGIVKISIWTLALCVTSGFALAGCRHVTEAPCPNCNQHLRYPVRPAGYDPSVQAELARLDAGVERTIILSETMIPPDADHPTIVPGRMRTATPGFSVVETAELPFFVPRPTRAFEQTEETPDETKSDELPRTDASPQKCPLPDSGPLPVKCPALDSPPADWSEVGPEDLPTTSTSAAVSLPELATTPPSTPSTLPIVSGSQFTCVTKACPTTCLFTSRSESAPSQPPPVPTVKVLDHSDDYQVLTGYAQSWRQVWRLRYADYDACDRYGGMVVLDGAELHGLQDGCHVRAVGRLVPPADRISPARFEVQSVEIIP